MAASPSEGDVLNCFFLFGSDEREAWMSKQKTEAVRFVWESAFSTPISEPSLTRLGGWIQAWGDLPVSRAIERAALMNRTTPEAEAIETIRLTLNNWKRRGWL